VSSEFLLRWFAASTLFWLEFKLVFAELSMYTSGSW
jgi:hypothetical protein